jgi:hypothetical protein
MSSDRDRAIAGEKFQNFSGFFFPATDKSRTIRFMGKWIQIYQETTYKMNIDRDDVSEETDFEVPSGYVCEVAGGKSSSVQFK